MRVTERLPVVLPAPVPGAAPWTRDRNGNRTPPAESEERVWLIAEGLARASARLEQASASDEELDAVVAAIHDPRHLARLERASTRLEPGEAHLDEELGPPGHHAGPTWIGGYCFLNNAAAAVYALRRNSRRVGLLDFDFHLGDGTAAILDRLPGTFFTSLHASPEHWYPWAGQPEDGEERATVAFDAAPTEEQFLAAFSTLLDRLAAWGVETLVVSVGFDVVRGDPHGSWSLDPSVLEEAAALLTRTGIPLCLVQEGGYNVETLTECASSFATGLDGTRSSTRSLERFRNRLDELDREIIERFGERFDVCRAIADVKRRGGIPMMQEGRVEAVRAHYRERGAAVSLPADFAERLFELVIESTCRLEDELIDGEAAA